MKKSYRIFVALVLMVLCAMDASAGLKRVPLTADMFFAWDGWGADAQKQSDTPATCAFELGTSSGLPYGDGNVINYADLSDYVSLEITFSAGTPRVLLNRDINDGQWNADEASSHLIEYPKGDDVWSAKYFKLDGNVLTVDLKQLVADKGFAHLHAIKGANWQKVTVDKLSLISDDGRVELEAEMFHAWTTDGLDAEIIEEPEPWSDGATFGCEVNFFKNLDAGGVCYGNTSVIWQWYADLTGTKKMHFYGEPGLTLRVLCNRPPMPEGGSDVHGGQTVENQVTIGSDGTATLDIEALNLPYFHLNCIKVNWGTHGYFKNVEIEGPIQGSGKIYDPMDDVKAGFEADVVSINLGKNTNLNELLKGNERILFPNENGKLTVNGKDIKLISVESFFDDNGDARVFLFIEDLNDAIDGDEADVKVTFINPTDPAMQLTFASGRFEGTVIPDMIDMAAEYEEGLGNYYTNQAKLPVVVGAVPELGSINLPVDKTDFKVMFSGNVNIAELKATFDGAPMTVAPAEGFASELTLTRAAGNLTPGVHEILLSNIKAEQDFLEEVGEESIKYSFGYVDSEETVQTFMTDGFAESGDGSVPASWIFDMEGEDRNNLTGQWGGCRILVNAAGANGFTPAIAYICPRNNASDGHAIYGAMEDYRLRLTPNTYHLTLGAASWDCDNPWLKVQVTRLYSVEPDVRVLDDGTSKNYYLIDDELVEETMVEVKPSYKNSKDAVRIDLPFTIEEEDDYLLKFFPCTAEGNPGGYGTAVAIGDIAVQYIPDVMGIEMMQALKQALADATSVRDANASERYAGEAFTTLNNLVNKYTTETICQPSEFDAAVAELKAAAEAMTAHHTLCDNFDALPAKLYASIEQFADTKFAADPIYAEMQTVFAKYATVKEETQVIEEVETVVKVVEPKLITDDAELNAAIAELNAIIAKAGMFTEGASSNNTTGYAALHERLRVGVETALALGIAEDDPAVVAANAELGDNDQIANTLKIAITKQLYTNLKASAAISEPVDMTVFIKNPNIYVTKASKQDVTAAPGWTLTNFGEGSLGDIWYTAGGGTHLATDVVPADEAITSMGNVAFTQQITDLPAGIYSVTAYMGERRSDNDFRGFGTLPEDLPEDITEDEKNALQLEDARAKIFPQEFVFVNTTATAEGEYDNQTPVVSNGMSWGATDNNRIFSDEITITDGNATIGVRSSGQNTWFAFNEIHLTLIAPAAGFDYAKGLEDFLAGIETLDATAAKVRAIELFDLNGRRINTARQGIVIVKKHMSDGSVITEKVIRK